MSGPSGYGTQKQCSTVCKVLETEIDSEDTNKIYFGCELLYANS